jgi:hypothetical protein
LPIVADNSAMRLFVAKTLRSLLPVLIVALSAGVLAGSAGATPTSVGLPLDQEPTDNSDGLRYVQSRLPDGSAFSGSPVAGVLTSVQVRTSGDAGTLTVVVYRPMSPLTGEIDLMRVAELPVTVTADATSAGHLTDTPTRVSIAVGDRFGFDYPNRDIKAFQSNYGTPANMCSYLSLGTPLALGATATFVNNTCNANWPGVLGTVEPDADGDGYGDDSQDACPSDAARQLACLLPANLKLRAIASSARKRKKATRTFEIANSGEIATGRVPFSVKSSRSVRRLRIVSGCKTGRSKRACVVSSIAPGKKVRIKVSLELKRATKTTLTARSGKLTARTTVRFARRQKQ